MPPYAAFSTGSLSNCKLEHATKYSPHNVRAHLRRKAVRLPVARWGCGDHRVLAGPINPDGA